MDQETPGTEIRVSVLADLRDLLGKATPGPWAYDQHEDGWALGLVVDDDEKPLSGRIEVDEGTVVEHVASGPVGLDAALVVALHNAADDLLACVEAAEQMDEWLRRFTPEPEVGQPGFAVRRHLREALARLERGSG
jgi:hypothetical protein